MFVNIVYVVYMNNVFSVDNKVFWCFCYVKVEWCIVIDIKNIICVRVIVMVEYVGNFLLNMV